MIERYLSLEVDKIKGKKVTKLSLKRLVRSLSTHLFSRHLLIIVLIIVLEFIAKLLSVYVSPSYIDSSN